MNETVQIGTVRPGSSTISKVVTLVAVVVPPLGLLSAIGLLWGVGVHPVDLVLLVGLYVGCAFGTTIGFHRYFTHRSFTAHPSVKVALAILGCMTMQGPITQWVQRPPQASRPVRQARRPPLPARRPRRRRRRCDPRLRPRTCRMAVLQPRHGAGPARTRRTCYDDRVDPLDRPALPPLGHAHARHPVRDRLPRRRHLAERCRGPRLGRPHPHLPLPARDVQRELDLSHVRPPRLRLPGRVAQQLVRRRARLRRGVAQQPPRVSRVRPARPSPLTDRHLVVGDPRPRARRPRLERAYPGRGTAHAPPASTRPRPAPEPAAGVCPRQANQST